MGDGFPSKKGGEMDRLLRRLCGDPVQQRGSHRKFVGHTGEKFTFAVHDSDTVPSWLVRRILVRDVGLTEDEAREVV